MVTFMPIPVGLLLGANVIIMLIQPSPVTIGCTVVTGCMFLVALVLAMKR